MFSEMQELKRINAELSEKATRAAYEAEYTRNLVDTFSKGVPKQQEPVPAIPEITDDEFLQNPGRALDKKIAAYFERDKAEREREKREAYVERAKNLFETGSKTAGEKLGKLLTGIDHEVKQYVQQGIVSGSINPEAATNPELWASTALMLRYMKGERDFNKYFSEPRQGMAPSYTETPTAGQPPKAEVVLSPEQEELISRGNITREQFMEARARVRAESEGRKL